MSKQHKISTELCSTCKYKTYFSAGGIYNKKWPASVACGYCSTTGESRVFKDGRYREDYKPGYCMVYEERSETK
jgi:hypothetical protein